MPQYLVAVQHPDTFDAAKEGPEMIQDIKALNVEMAAAGARFFAGGLEPATKAKSLRKNGDAISITDGPFLEAKEHIGGFWILECSNMDEAIAWGKKATVACRVSVEVRAFLEIPTASKASPDKPFEAKKL